MTRKKIIYYFIAAVFLVAVDQSSKSFLISYLKTQPGYVLEIIPILDLVYAWNYGISFGLFREYYRYSNIIFLILNSVIIIYLCVLISQAKTCLMRLALILIISGALGNLIDRILRGAVFDFIYFHYYNLSFPIFNMADTFITLGACCFIYNYLFCNDK